MLDLRYFSGRRVLDLSRNTWLLSWNVRPTWAVFKASWRSVVPSVALVFGLFLSLQREVHIFIIYFLSLTWIKVRKKREYHETVTYKSVNETLRFVRPDEMEALEQHVVPSCCVVYFALQGGLTFEFVWRAVWSATIQMKSSEQYIAVVLCILLHLQSTFHDHLSLWMKSLSVTRQTKVIERYCNCLPYAVQGGSKFWVCG